MDEQLVQRYAPILRFDQAENFFPMRVRDFVRLGSIHAIEAGKGFLYVPPGYASLEDLTLFAAPDHYVAFADRRVLNEASARAMEQLFAERGLAKGIDVDGLKRRVRERLEATGVKLLNVFGTFHLPEEVLKLALARYVGLATHRPRYYCRVVEAGAYRVLQYWYFYAYNDFGSSHGGSNDHEGDWESVSVYLEDDKPVWVMGSAHSSDGAAHRLAWAAAELEKVGTQPVVYVAAGSHANYFSAALAPLEKGFLAGGTAIGGLDGEAWEPPGALTFPWFTAYRGRWGARQWDQWGDEIRDRFSGPPAGPKFNRDGSVREAWERPLVYAGLV